MDTPSVECLLHTHAHMDRAEIHPVAGGYAGVLTARSPDRGDEPNEDSIGIIRIGKDAGILVLADGVGGARAGAMASKTAIVKVKEAIEQGLATGRVLRACIVDGFETANEAILGTGLGAATTLVVLEIQSGTVRPYHVGDSAIIVVGQRGKLKLQTVAHSPVGYAVESGVLDEKEAMDHEERHVVSNVVGSPDMHIALGPAVEMKRRDTVVLASDGLTDNLHSDEIVEIIRAGPLKKALQKLSRAASEAMLNPSADRPSKPDDLSFIVFRWSS